MAAASSADAPKLEMVTLKDGTEVPLSAYKTTMLNIDNIRDNTVFAELLRKCRQPDYTMNPFAKADVTLKRLSLMDSDGKINKIVRSIVLNGTDENQGVNNATMMDPRKVTKK